MSKKSLLILIPCLLLCGASAYAAADGADALNTPAATATTSSDSTNATAADAAPVDFADSQAAADPAA